ncbi:MAG: hypothetical protein COC12_09335 [Rhodobacteraceae bacterium]|nr:MAG: hypothetical protein COC12_09335 [Paracoccaceae bacterium]
MRDHRRHAGAGCRDGGDPGADQGDAVKAGWEVKPLEKCIEPFKVAGKIPRKQFQSEGPFPIVSQEADYINGYWADEANLNKIAKPLVIFGDHTQVIKYIDFDFVVGADGVKVLQPRDGLDAKFFAYFLEAHPVKSLGYARHFRHMRSLSVPIPPLEEQKRIVAVLDAAFEGLTRAKENAEANLQNARELFESATDAVFSTSGNWTQVPIGDFGEVFDGPHATPKTVDSGPLFLGISSLVDGRIELTKTRHVTDEDYATWTRRVEPREDDVVFAYETRLGQIGLIPPDLKCCLGRRMGLVRLDQSKVRPDFFVLCYLSPHFQRFIADKTVKGATVDRISVKDFPNFPFPLPDIKSQGLIVEQLHAIRHEHDKLLISCKNKLKDIADLRQSLLQKAFAGELT